MKKQFLFVFSILICATAFAQQHDSTKTVKKKDSTFLLTEIPVTGGSPFYFSYGETLVGNVTFSQLFLDSIRKADSILFTNGGLKHPKRNDTSSVSLPKYLTGVWPNPNDTVLVWRLMVDTTPYQFRVYSNDWRNWHDTSSNDVYGISQIIEYRKFWEVRQLVSDIQFTKDENFVVNSHYQHIKYLQYRDRSEVPKTWVVFEVTSATDAPPINTLYQGTLTPTSHF